MSFSTLSLLLTLPFLLGAVDLPEGRDTNPCAVAREITVKGITLFDYKPKEGLKAIEEAYKICPSEAGIGYNLGLAHYLSNDLKSANQQWQTQYKDFPNHEKTLVNLAWVKFEMGNDKEAHKLAFEGIEIYPNNWGLAHTKLYSLFRMGRYLEAYDWLTRSGLKGLRADQWLNQAAGYVVETLWRQFRRGREMMAVRQAVNLLVKEYPSQSSFVQAKDALIHAYLDPNAEVPYTTALPHEYWPKSGNTDDKSAVLDDEINAIPAIAGWKKRENAYAVMVGINRYHRLRARHYSDRDAQNMHQLLTSRGVFKKDADHVRLRTNQEATLNTLTNDLKWLVRQGKLDSNALLVFYFSGLGVAWEKDALLIPVEATLETITPKTTLSLNHLKTVLDTLPNQDILVILDTCFNGTKACNLGKESTLTLGKDFFNGVSTWTVAALDQEAVSYGKGQHNGLTYFLLKGMLGEGDGANGSDADGWVDMDEAFTFAKKNLDIHLRTTQKVPTLTSDIFLSKPSKIRLSRVGGER